MARTTAGLDSNAVSDSGGAERITLDAGGLGQGADVPCRKVFITQPFANTLVARVNVSAAASDVLGIDIPCGSTAAATGPRQPSVLELNVSNTNLLYFVGTVGDFVDLVYLK